MYDDVLLVGGCLLAWQASVEAFLKPKDALDAFAKQPDTFDIVVTDIKMSVMTGFELAGRIRAIRPKMPIIFITAFDIQQSISELPDGADVPYENVFRKPFDPSALRDSILSKPERE